MSLGTRAQGVRREALARGAWICALAALVLVPGAIAFGPSAAPHAPPAPSVPSSLSRSTSASHPDPSPSGEGITASSGAASPTSGSAHLSPASQLLSGSSFVSDARSVPSSTSPGTALPHDAAGQGGVPQAHQTAAGDSPATVHPLGTASLTANGESSSLALDVDEGVTFSWSYDPSPYACSNGAYDWCLYDMSDGDGGSYDASLTDCTGSTTGSWADSYASTGTFTAGDPASGAGSYNAYAEYEAPCEDGYVDAAAFNTISVTVNPTLTAPSTPEVSATRLDANQVLTVQSTLASTGTPTYSWDWLASVNGGGYAATGVCSTSSGSGASGGAVETCSVPASTLTAGDTYSFELKVTDSANGPAETATSGGSSTVTVYSPLTGPSTPSVSATKLDVNQALSAQSTLSSTGAPSYSWDWYVSVNGGGWTTPACGTASGSGAGGGATETCSIAANALSVGSTYVFLLQQWDTATTAEWANSASSATVTVYSALTAPPVPSVSATVLDVNQVLTSQSTLASTGAPTYSWSWLASVNGGGFAATSLCTTHSGSGASGGAVETCSVPANTLAAGSTYAFELQVTDTATAPETATSTASPTVTVNSALLAPSTPSVSATALDVNQVLTVQSTLSSSGSPSYSWSWWVSVNGGGYAASSLCAVNSGSGAAGGTVETCSIAASTLVAGDTYAFELHASDSASTPETVASSASATVAVYAVPSAGAVTPASPTIDSPQSILLTSHESGGTPTIAYQWYSSASGSGVCTSGSSIAGASSTTYDVTSLATSTYFCYEATDSSGAGAESAGSAWDLVTVNGPLEAGAVTPTSGAVDQGESITLTSSSPSGGTAPYSYQWMSGSSGTCSSDSAVAGQTATTYSPAPASSTYFCVRYGDSSSGTPASIVYSNVVYVTVSADPTVTVSPVGPLTYDAGQSAATLTATVAYSGSNTITIDWYSSSGASCSASSTFTGATGATYPLSTTSASSSYYCAVVTDSGLPGYTSASNAVDVTVNADVSLTAIRETGPISCAATCAADAHQTLSVATVASQGTPAYVFTWTVTAGSADCSGSASGAVTSTYSCTVAAVASPTTWTITVYVEDSVACYYPTSGTACSGPPNGAQALSFTVTLNPDPTVVQSPSTSQSNESGQVNNFTATVSGGSPAYAYQWLVNGSASQASVYPGAATAKFAFQPAHPGTYVVNLSVTDAAGFVVWTPGVTEVASPGPAVSLTASRVTVDAGTLVVLFGNYSGGSPPITLTYRVNGNVVQSSSDLRDYNVSTSTAGTYTVTFTESDNQHSSATATVVITVNADPSIAVSLSTPGVDVGELVNATGAIVGGTAPFACRWYVNGTLQPGATCALLSYPTTHPGPLVLNVTVTDAFGWSASSLAVTVQVQPRPLASLSPPLSTVDAGQKVLLTAAITGGTAGFTCQWIVNSTLLSGATSCAAYVFIPTHGGTYELAIHVTDSATPAVSAWGFANVTAGPALRVAVSPSGGTVDVGTALSFLASAAGGAPSYLYTWWVNGVQVASTSTAYSFSGAAAGVYTVGVEVTDTNLNAVVVNATVTVNALPSLVLSPSGTVNTGVGATVNFAATVSLGTGPFGTVIWFVDGVYAGQGSTFAFSELGAKTYTVNASVVDADGNWARSPVTSIVVAQLLVAGTGATESEVGLGSTYSATAKGGVGPYTYQWRVDLVDVVGATGATFAWTATQSGVANVSVVVTDATGLNATWGVDVNVVAAVQASLALGASTIDLGMSSGLTPSATGGLGPFTFSWTLNGAAWTGSSAPPTTGSPFSFSPVSAGIYRVSVEVTDDLGATNTSSIQTVTVDPLPTVTLSANTTTPSAGSPIALTATVAGGTPGYSFSWTLNGTALSGSSASLTYTPLGGGSYVFQVQVTDSLGKVASSAPLTLTVGPNPALGSHTGSTSSFPLWLVLVIVGLAVAALLLILVLRRRRKQPSEDLSKAPMGGTTGAGASGVAGGAAVAGATASLDLLAPSPTPDGAYAASLEGSGEVPPPPSVQEVPRAPSETAGSSYLPVAEVPMPEVSAPSAPPAPTEPEAPPVKPLPAVSPIRVAPVHPATQARGLSGSREADVSGLPHCSTCGSPLPSARSECLVCASVSDEPLREKGSTSASKPAPEEPPAGPDRAPPPAQGDRLPATPAAAAPPTPAIPVPIADRPTPPPTSGSSPSASTPHPRVCYICGAALNASSVCPTCGIDWTDRGA